MEELLHDLATLRVNEPERDTPEFWSSVGLKLFDEFKNKDCGHQCCIDNTISAYAKAVHASSAKNPKYMTYLHDLAYALYYKYRAFWNLQDIDRAILIYGMIIDLYPKSESHIQHLSTLHIFQESRFEQTRTKEDVNNAVTTAKRVLELTPQSTVDCVGPMNSLACNLNSRFDISADINDIDEAILLLRRALELEPGDPGCLSNLGLNLRIRFEHVGDIRNLEEAIEVQRIAIKDADDSDPTLYNKLSNLAVHLATRYSHLGSASDLEESISIQERSVELLKDDHPYLPSMLYNLGTKFRTKYLRTGDLQDIQRSVYLMRKSMSYYLPHSPDLPTIMGDLGNALSTRFTHSGDINDLNEAIEMQKKALESLPVGHADVGRMLTNLGGRLISRFNNTYDTRDLEEAIDVNRAAIMHTPETHPFITGRLTNLASALDNLYLVTGEQAAIEEAIEVQRRAVRLSSDKHPAMPNYLDFLGRVLESRFKQTGDISDLMEARDVMEKAISITPEDHPLIPSHFNHLGSILETIHGYTNDFETIDNASAHYKHAATAGKQDVCIRAAQNWARISNKRGSMDEVMAAYTHAFDLLPHVAWLGYTVAHRHSQLRMISQLASEASATAFALGEAVTAVEWLEQGRGIVWSQLNQLRTPLDDLQRVSPDIARELAQISTELERGGSGTRSDIPNSDIAGKLVLQEEAQNQQEMARKRENLLEKIRKIPGFETFLKPLKFSRITSGIPEDGPVVLINVHSSRCDAVVLRKNQEQPTHIPLPYISFDQVVELQSALRENVTTQGVRSREERSGRVAQWELQENGKSLQEILAILWNNIAKPLLDKMELMYHGLESPTRIWWCPTGPLAFLPLHAAGLYGDSRKRGFTLSEYVISSYTPTVSALFEKTNMKRHQQDFKGILTVSVPNAPELHPIPNTTEECEWISNKFSSEGFEATSLDQEAATVKGVIDAMHSHNWIHLACHASQNLHEPTKSAFYLHDGELELMEIMHKNLLNAELAFLSACQTSAGTETLSEEVVHLAAGMLMAGYRSIIATLWSIEDQVALIMSRKVYSYLLKESDAKIPDSSRAAEALHFATLELRGQLDSSDASLLSWVPYIHMGL